MLWFGDGVTPHIIGARSAGCGVAPRLRGYRSWDGPASVLAVFPTSGGTWEYATHPGFPSSLSNTNLEPPGRGPAEASHSDLVTTPHLGGSRVLTLRRDSRAPFGVERAGREDLVQ